MKFSEAWLREWIDPQVSAEELGQRLTMAGLELDGIAPAAPQVPGVVVAKVKSIAKHPDADKLNVCQVDSGGQQTDQVVCGAPNVRKGMTVAMATVGATLPNGTEIKAAKLRGVESNGMLCSAAELGLSEESAGLLELNDQLALGESITAALQLDDNVFDIDLTPNRADCLSILGVAREISALYAMPYQSANVNQQAEITSDATFAVDVTAPEDCPRYCGRIIQGVDVCAVSPIWMQERLRRAGVRSINIVVDICNYVMLELGQPMHAFDLNKLQGKIEVRHAQAGEMLTLLDGKEISLQSSNLVIADQAKALALAGIMGGLESAVQDSSGDIFLESAFFDPITIAGKARDFGLHTDSSHRFERGVDPELAPIALARATNLILELASGNAGVVVEVKNEHYMPRSSSIMLQCANVSKLLGIEIGPAEIKQVLENLSCQINELNDNELEVIPPSYRFDLNIDVDLIEEIARIRGYDALPTLPFTASAAGVAETQPRFQLQQAMMEAGYNEAVTFSFTEEKYCRLFSDSSAKSLANPISSELSTMRTSLWPGLCMAANYNLKRQQSSVRLFELGRKYLVESAAVDHIDLLAGIAVGDAYPRQWGVDARNIDFYDVKGELDDLFARLSMASQIEYQTADQLIGLHPGKSAQIFYGQDCIGAIGVLHPNQAKEFELTGKEVVVFEVMTDKLFEPRERVNFQKWSKFPSVSRDLSLIVKQNVSVQTLLDSVTSLGIPELKDISVFAVYTGKGVPEGTKSVSLGLILQDFSSTLTDQKVEELITNITSVLASSTGAQLRN